MQIKKLIIFFWWEFFGTTCVVLTNPALTKPGSQALHTKCGLFQQKRSKMLDMKRRGAPTGGYGRVGKHFRPFVDSSAAGWLVELVGWNSRTEKQGPHRA